MTKEQLKAAWDEYCAKMDSAVDRFWTEDVTRITHDFWSRLGKSDEDIAAALESAKADFIRDLRENFGMNDEMYQNIEDFYCEEAAHE